MKFLNYTGNFRTYQTGVGVELGVSNRSKNFCTCLKQMHWLRVVCKRRSLGNLYDDKDGRYQKKRRGYQGSVVVCVCVCVSVGCVGKGDGEGRA